MIKCKQCGDVLPEDMFRQYYNSPGRYRVCLKCEKINSRAKYLTRKGDKATKAEKDELARIEQLYEYQRLMGLKPPRRRKDVQEKLDEFDRILQKYKEAANTVPVELQEWLSAELTLEPEVYTDEIYDSLVKKYKPIVGLDPDTQMPVYDETHSETLAKILERFCEYEDSYYS